ncbi:MAG: carotenoid oxygenase family protein, partial [Gammaproteobacteria bacterium]|nr:carotenoid oxygenase family protein [Gammaproteobacteria bacterium]
MPLTRRSFIAKTAAVGAGGLAIASVVPGVKAGARKEALSAPDWMTLLGKSEAGARDYAARVEGEIPRSLRGVLYRNGPGMFERGAERRRHLLDGDGLIQRLSIGAQGARYQNAFVQTQKFKDDE